MKTFRLEKLVRDTDPAWVSKNRGTCDVVTLEGEKKLKALQAKCFEEIGELFNAKTKDEQKAEFADVFEVLYAYANILGIDLEEIEKQRQNKKNERGSFQKGFFIKSASVPPSSKLYDYFIANPDRYPEII